MKLHQQLIGCAAVALLAISSAQAQFSIDTVVTENAGVYSYSYTFTNLTAQDVLIVALDGFAAVPAAVQSLTVPTGFIGSFDSGAGTVFFTEDTNTFSASSVLSGFSFESMFAPGAGTFEATDAMGASFTGAATVAAVPEPASAALIGGAFIGFIALGRRRARA